MNKRIAAILATGALCLGLSAVAAAPAQAATPSITWTCKAGERAIVIASYGNLWKACQNTTTRKIRIIGAFG